MVGFASSFLGIGGGVIHVPLLVRALGFPTHFAHGYGIRRAVALSLGVVVGAQLGARLSLRASGRIVEALLGIALLALAARLALAAM